MLNGVDTDVLPEDGGRIGSAESYVYGEAGDGIPCGRRWRHGNPPYIPIGGKLHGWIASPHCDGAAVTPSKQELQDKAKHFANTVFVIGAGVIMFAASLLQPYTMQWLGGATGEQFPFIAGTLLIVLLALKRPAFALFALERQCREYGHVMREGSSTCERCFQNVDDSRGS